MAAGRSDYGGDVVVNPRGGLIGCGHPLGATGVAQAAEVFVQLRDEAGARQVPDAAIGLTHNNSGMGEHVVMIYGKEPGVIDVARSGRALKRDRRGARAGPDRPPDRAGVRARRLPVRLVDAKEGRAAGEAERTLADARREIARDVGLMVEEQVIDQAESVAVLGRIEERIGLDALAGCGFVQEALPESVAAQAGHVRPAHGRGRRRRHHRVGVVHHLALGRLLTPSSARSAFSSRTGSTRLTSSRWWTWCPGPRTAPETVTRTLALLESLGKTPVRCGDSPGFIGPRLQVLLMNEAVRLVEEGVATPEDVDRAFRAGMGFRYASIGIFEFIDWGGVDILYRASRYMTEALGDERFRPARMVEEKMARNELGPKTGRGFFDYTGDRREAFETEKLRALLRRLRIERQ